MRSRVGFVMLMISLGLLAMAANGCQREPGGKEHGGKEHGGAATTHEHGGKEHGGTPTN